MKVRILREAGGLGDVLCTLPVARAVKERWPDCTLSYYCLPDYEGVIDHCPDVDEFVGVPMDGRRPRDVEPDPARFPYLAEENLPEHVRRSLGEGGFDKTIDLWCPAFRYERRMSEKIDKSRIEVFCETAGLVPSDYCPRFVLSEEEKAWARGWIEAKGESRGPKVALQPFSHNNRRDWPEENWIELATRLLKLGAMVLVFHSFFSKVKAVPGHKVTGMDIWKAAAILSQCDFAVTPDSGIFHLAAAVNVPALGLFGSTSADQTAKHYPLSRTLWPTDRPREHRCRVPCHSFGWCGCDEACHEKGCEVLKATSVGEVARLVGNTACACSSA